LGSVDRVANATNVGQLLAGASGVINNASRIGATLGINSKASGLSSLPGGQLSVSSLVNQAFKGVQLPGLPGLKSVLTSSVSTAINNIPISNPMGQSKSKLDSLKSLTLSGLSPGAASQLNSAISALSSTGSSPVKLPTVGINTNDRSESDAQIASLFGNSKIPKPNFSGVSSTGIGNLEALREQNKRFIELQKQISEAYEKSQIAKKSYFTAKQTLPAGDPAIEEALNEWIFISEQFKELTLAQEKLMGYK